MKNISQKPRHRNVPLKRLTSIVVDRYAQATVLERKSVLSFFDWIISNTQDAELKAFHVEVKAKFAEVK